MKEIKKFKEPIEWMLGEEKVLISKLEIVTTAPEDQEIIKNVIKNAALMPNGVFLESTSKNILVRISDLVKNTLIQTQWYIPTELFSRISILLQVENNIPEHKFYVISKIS